MFPYTVEGLARETKMGPSSAEGAGAEAGGDATASPAAEPKDAAGADAEEATDCHNPCTTYRLKAVVVHQGSAQAGHYYVYTRVRATPETRRNTLADQWLKFNDDSVTTETVRVLGVVGLWAWRLCA